MPNWEMTGDVVSLLAKIEADKAWDILPILADALEEAGCDDVGLLLALRNDLRYNDDYLRRPWLRRMVEGEVTYAEVAEAVDYMTDFADRFREDDWSDEGESWHWETTPAEDRPKKDALLDFDDMLKICDNYLKTGESAGFGFDTPDYVYAESERMWESYSVLTGPLPKMIPEERYRWATITSEVETEVVKVPFDGGYPFRCSC